jgi:hypothetical protein
VLILFISAVPIGLLLTDMAADDDDMTILQAMSFFFVPICVVFCMEVIRQWWFSDSVSLRGSASSFSSEQSLSKRDNLTEQPTQNPLSNRNQSFDRSTSVNNYPFKQSSSGPGLKDNFESLRGTNNDLRSYEMRASDHATVQMFGSS